VDREPPPISIVDPNAPSGTADLLDSGRDPWRPSRRQVVLTVTAVLVLALVAGAVALLVLNVQAQRADRRAVRALSFELGGDVEAQPDNGLSISLELRNLTRYPYTVVDVRLDGPGFGTATLGTRLAPRASAFLDLPTSSACDASLYVRGPRAAVVRARTARGTLVTGRVPLDRATADDAWPRFRRSCHYLLPDEALGASASGFSFEGRTLTVRYGLENAAAVPLTIDRLTTADGVELISDDLPLTIPAGTGDYQGFGHRTLTVRLRVVDCSALRQVLARAAGGDGLDGPNTLKVALHHRYDQGHAWLELSALLPGDVSVDHFQDLVRTCS
jgi:hypothetical protein